MSFDKHACLLKLRCGSQLLESKHQPAWVRMVEELIKVDLRTDPNKRQCKFWSMHEAIMVKMPLHTSAKTMDSSLQSWVSVNQDNIAFDHQLDLMSGNLSLYQLLELMARKENLPNGQVESIIAYCRVQHISSVKDLWRGADGWMIAKLIHGALRRNQNPSTSMFVPILDFVKGSLGCGGPLCSLTGLKGWKWIGREGIFIGWSLPMEQWKAMIDTSAPITMALDRRWNIPRRQVLWHPIWKVMWFGWGLPRARMII